MAMQVIKGILFDNDGVLAHTEQAWFDTFHSLLSDLGVTYGRKDFITHTFVEGWGSIEWLRRNAVEPEIIAAFEPKRIEAWRKRIADIDVTEPTAVPVLTELKATYKLGVVTNTERENFLKIHTYNSLINILDALIVREDYSKGKPAPDGYLAGVEKLGLASDSIIAVEDAPRGIRAAKAAGLSVVGIINPAFPELDISDADYQIRSLTDLPGLLRQIYQGFTS